MRHNLSYDTAPLRKILRKKSNLAFKIVCQLTDCGFYLLLGAIPKDDGKPNPLDEMSEQEKEEEAEKLANLIHDLNRKGVIKTAQVGPDGRPQEFQGAHYMGEQAPEQENEPTKQAGSTANGKTEDTKPKDSEGNPTS